MNYDELPPSLVASLAVGLRDDSRTKMKLSGQRISLEQCLMALQVDLLGAILRQRAKHKTKLKSIYETLIEPPKPREELETFSSIDDFEKWYSSKQQRRSDNG